MMLALAREGRTIGITANSQKVIRHLLDELGVPSREQGFTVEYLQKLSDGEDDWPGHGFTTDNGAFLDALNADSCVGGATAWFWARPDVVESVDVLLIDGADQMSLANVLAVSQAARSVVLLGDLRRCPGSSPYGIARPTGVGRSEEGAG